MYSFAFMSGLDWSPQERRQTPCLGAAAGWTLPSLGWLGSSLVPWAAEPLCSICAHCSPAVSGRRPPALGAFCPQKHPPSCLPEGDLLTSALCSCFLCWAGLFSWHPGHMGCFSSVLLLFTGTGNLSNLYGDAFLGAAGGALAVGLRMQGLWCTFGFPGPFVALCLCRCLSLLGLPFSVL